MGEQVTQVPEIIHRPEGQLEAQVLLLRLKVGWQDRQKVIEVWQVKQLPPQAAQT